MLQLLQLEGACAFLYSLLMVYIGKQKLSSAMAVKRLLLPKQFLKKVWKILECAKSGIHNLYDTKHFWPS